jgi:hypothetical protein
LKTRITEQYGLKVPFINAGMAFFATAPLVRAVCSAGGMGMLGSAAMPPDGLQAGSISSQGSAGPSTSRYASRKERWWWCSSGTIRPTTGYRVYGRPAAISGFKLAVWPKQGPLSELAGESVRQTKRLMSVADIIDEMMNGAEVVIRKRLGSIIAGHEGDSPDNGRRRLVSYTKRAQKGADVLATRSTRSIGSISSRSGSIDTSVCFNRIRRHRLSVSLPTVRILLAMSRFSAREPEHPVATILRMGRIGAQGSRRYVRHFTQTC